MIIYQKWSRSSESWSEREIVSNESIIESRSPKIQIDSEDNLHVCWQDYSDYNSSGGDLDLFYKIRNATTESWSLTDVLTYNSDKAILRVVLYRYQ